jgi:hypothetical protein
MKAKVLALLLLSAAIIVPAAVPASQPADIRLGTLAAPAITIAPADFLALLADPSRAAELSVELVDGYTTLEWINQDPFAL